MPNTTPSDHDAARSLAERGLREQQTGNTSEADQTLKRAMQVDPDAVLEVLHETGADTAPDARDAGTDQDAAPPDAFQQKPDAATKRQP